MAGKDNDYFNLLKYKEFTFHFGYIKTILVVILLSHHGSFTFHYVYIKTRSTKFAHNQAS